MAAASRNAARRAARKAVKKLHPVTKAVAIVCLLLGLVAGAAACYFVSRGDHFELKGEKTYSLDAGAEGATYLYTEEGVDAVCFGQDVSGRMNAETDLQKNEAGQYVIPLDQEGTYTITYTVNAVKFGEKAPNGQICRIRTFVVSTGEEDGRGE